MELSILESATGLLVLDNILNADSEEFLNSNIKDAAQKGLNRVILDFRPVDHMSNFGAACLVKLAALAKKHDIKLFAYGLGKRYREIFALVCLDDTIGIIGEDRVGNGLVSTENIAVIEKTGVNQGKQSDTGWAPYVERIKVTEKPKGALAKNMNNHRIQGQAQGFGKLWQKTFWLSIDKPQLTPEGVIKTLMENFVAFQIPENFFYPTSKGLNPGALVFIDSLTPGGVVSTGIYVLYVDATSFSYITPKGHPEAGWITFSAGRQDGLIRVQIQGIMRASDPIFEVAYAVAGQAFQEKIWLNVLTQLSKKLEVEDNGQMVKYKPDSRCQWGKWTNIWYNAQMRSIPLTFTKWHWLSKKAKEKRISGGY